MTLGAHITPNARNHIEQADVVFVAVSDGIVEQWIMDMHPDVRSLQNYYEEGKSRKITYRQMVEAMMTEVRAGRKVCGVFYGHPGVFAWAPHKSIEVARDEGFRAYMVPGISAEDCLIADLGIDPGKWGCFQLEASQLLMFHRRIDTTALLILWQVGLVGDLEFSRYSTGRPEREIFVQRLMQDYPGDHEVILYEAATLPLMNHRAERLPLKDLRDAQLNLETTLVIPPASPLQPNEDIRAALKNATKGQPER
jgi:precorrin-3B methylase